MVCNKACKKAPDDIGKLKLVKNTGGNTND